LRLEVDLGSLAANEKDFGFLDRRRWLFGWHFLGDVVASIVLGLDSHDFFRAIADSSFLADNTETSGDLSGFRDVWIRLRKSLAAGDLGKYSVWSKTSHAGDAEQLPGNVPIPSMRDRYV